MCICYWTVYETKAKAILKSRRLFMKIFYLLKQKSFGSTDIEGMNTKFVPPNPDIAPLVVHRNSWQLIKCGRGSKYYRTGNFCPQTFLALYRGLTVSSVQLLTPPYTIAQTVPNAPAALHCRLPVTFTLHCKQQYPFFTPDIATRL